MTELPTEFLTCAYFRRKDGSGRPLRLSMVRDGKVNYSVDGVFTLTPRWMPVDEFRRWIESDFEPASPPAEECLTV